MNYKPFDLQKALAGEPVRFLESDFEVAEIFHSKTREANSQQSVIVIAKNGNEYQLWPDGRRYKGGEDPFDLVMAPVKKTVWVNMYQETTTGSIKVGKMTTYDSESAAKEAPGIVNSSYLGTYPIEIEL